MGEVVQLPGTYRETVREPEPPRGLTRWHIFGAIVCFVLLGGCEIADSVERLAGIPGEAVMREIDEGVDTAKQRVATKSHDWIERKKHPPRETLFADNFEREDNSRVGNDWDDGPSTGASIMDGKLSLTSGDSQSARTSRYVDLGAEFSGLHITYDQWVDPLRNGGQTIVSISLDGGDHIAYTGGIIPGTASAFDLRFETEGYQHTTIDNLSVTGTAKPFLGF